MAGLRFEICAECETSHPLMRNGEMSLHDVDGVRCAGSGDPQAHVKQREETAARRAKLERDRIAQAALRAERDKKARALSRDQDARQEALKLDPFHNPVDRRTFAPRHITHVVRGGLPEHGRHR